MIELDAIRLDVGGFAIGPLSLSVERGEHVMLMGPSGSGKSLVVELIAGFRAPSAGRLTLRGRDMTGVPPRERATGWVPQAQTLFPHLSVRQNIEYGLRAGAVAPEVAEERLQRFARRLELERLLDRRPPTLSIGERQRVALARALVMQFDILLLDEPFSSLEPGRRKQLWSLVRELHAELALTIVHITHDLEEARAFDRRVYMIEQGACVQSGRLEEVMRTPASTRIAAALGV